MAFRINLESLMPGYGNESDHDRAAMRAVNRAVMLSPQVIRFASGAAQAGIAVEGAGDRCSGEEVSAHTGGGYQRATISAAERPLQRR